jgi:hypothetical protein
LIDKRVFAEAMASLCATYRLQPDKTRSQTYYGVLNAFLTTHQFREACKDVLARCRHMPPPAELLETGQGFPKAKELPAPRMTEAERAARDEEQRRGYAGLKAELKAHGIDVDALIRPMPGGTTT